MTSTTDTEMFTARSNSLRRGFEDFHQFSSRKTPFFFCQSDAHTLTRQPKWDKDCAAVFQASHGITAISKCSEENLLFHKSFGRPFGSPSLIHRSMLALLAQEKG